MLEDTKQDKISNKTKSSLDTVQDNTALGTKNNDECYTKETDILAELSQWATLDKFRDKNIICPCDWDIVGNKDRNEWGMLEYKGKTYKNVYGITIVYDTDKFAVITNNVYKCVKKVRLTAEQAYVDFGFLQNNTNNLDTPVSIELMEEDIEDFLRNKLTCNFIKVLTQNARKWGIKSITASGYNPAANNGKGAGTPFQEIDYSKYDICITNPPFSLYAEFMQAIIGKVDYIILAPFNNRNSPCVGLPLMLKTAYLGFGIERHMSFNNPTKANNYHGEKIVNCDWLTSYSEAQDARNSLHFKSGIKYDLYKDDYEILPNMIMKDGTCPIRVSMSTYPEDYAGWMFASSGVLDNLDQDTYEWYGTGFRRYFNQINPAINPFNGKVKSSILIRANGKKAFDNIVFRKKVTNND